jgi:hypothetical protein
MSKRDKKLKIWKNNTPKTVPKHEVEGILKYYLPNNYSWEGGSHIVIQHDELLKYQQYKPFGEISIPCSGGQRFKGVYLKELVKVLEILDLWQEEE